MAIQQVRAASRGEVNTVWVIDTDAHQGNGYARDKMHSADAHTIIVDLYNSGAAPLPVVLHHSCRVFMACIQQRLLLYSMYIHCWLPATSARRRRTVQHGVVTAVCGLCVQPARVPIVKTALLSRRIPSGQGGQACNQCREAIALRVHIRSILGWADSSAERGR
jgi:hypothetical protein